MGKTAEHQREMNELEADYLDSFADDQMQEQEDKMYQILCKAQEVVDAINSGISNEQLDGIDLQKDEFRRDFDGMSSGENLLKKYIAELLITQGFNK